MSTPADRFGRPLRNLRISVTDRCNLRCRYCMPESEYVWLPRSSILSFEEIDRLAGIFAGLGVGKIRLTGGEPLLRHDLPTLVRLLAAREAIRDLHNQYCFIRKFLLHREVPFYFVTVPEGWAGPKPRIMARWAGSGAR